MQQPHATTSTIEPWLLTHPISFNTVYPLQSLREKASVALADAQQQQQLVLQNAGATHKKMLEEALNSAQSRARDEHDVRAWD